MEDHHGDGVLDECSGFEHQFISIESCRGGEETDWKLEYVCLLWYFMFHGCIGIHLGHKYAGHKGKFERYGCHRSGRSKYCRLNVNNYGQTTKHQSLQQGEGKSKQWGLRFVLDKMWISSPVSSTSNYGCIVLAVQKFSEYHRRTVDGICRGLCIAVPKRYLEEWNDADSHASSIASDLEEAFFPNVNTPQRFGYDDLPPPSPSSSLKGLDTPIMRRSILMSPERVQRKTTKST